MVAVDPDTDRTVALRKARFKVRLRRAAEACGYENLYQLGRVCGISKDSFKKYLSGTRLPNYECILRLALVLGVPCDWLMGSDEGPMLRSVLKAREIDAAWKNKNTKAGLTCRERTCDDSHTRRETEC
ncbi:helix-turn-helix domain-containing protein [Collinsella sp. AF38-3AC]|uniref:helix-turn-helix domain-containing protein n=1 Tax=Collinsella sp. AF38-3AC TaxID=2292015 RepID=UPI000E47F650|nr:helix-turn-helix transcriptional regulator [Collinsella sp. AF38-3AC]RHL25400.1 XRE family transcriptional regulator [Collinsella sp. AF38-3AC]